MAFNSYAPRILSVDTSGSWAYFAHERKEVFEGQRDPITNRRPQKEINGVPVWNVTATHNGQLYKVSVPLKAEPELRSGTPIVFTNLEAGATNAGAFWFRADDVNLAD